MKLGKLLSQRWYKPRKVGSGVGLISVTIVTLISTERRKGVGRGSWEGVGVRKNMLKVVRQVILDVFPRLQPRRRSG